MGAYVVGDDGVLARHALTAADELRPLEASVASSARLR
jgi:hypothetical protein